MFDKLWRGLEVVHLLVPPIPATLDEEEMNSVAATYTQEIEAIEVILSKANVILREFEDREKNVQQHVSTLQPAIFPSLLSCLSYIYIYIQYLRNIINETYRMPTCNHLSSYWKT